MNSHDLLSDFQFAPGDPRQAQLQLRLFLLYLADHVYHLRDATDFRKFLLDMAEAIRQESQAASGPQLSPGPKVRPPFQQRRWNEFCPECGHIHADETECGFPIGGGRICRCERAVVA